MLKINVKENYSILVGDDIKIIIAQVVFSKRVGAHIKMIFEIKGREPFVRRLVAPRSLEVCDGVTMKLLKVIPKENIAALGFIAPIEITIEKVTQS